MGRNGKIRLSQTRATSYERITSKYGNSHGYLEKRTRQIIVTKEVRRGVVHCPPYLTN